MPSRDASLRAFALALAKSLGVEGAVDCARRNRWQDVLGELLTLDRRSDCDARAG